ncbi:MAG: DUF3619 family protein [Burkholderiaceae bacterium]
MKRLATHNDANQRAGLQPRTEDAQHRFAARIRQALNESAAALAPATLERLATARKAALRAQKQPQPRRASAWQPELAYAYAGGSDGGDRSDNKSGFGFARVGLAFSALLVVGACLAGLYQFEQQRRIEELADMDAAVLTDDLPISAYTDHGFNAFLKQNP